MSDRTATPEHAPRQEAARAGRLSSQRTVGDYVGQPAGDAAQAVRRAGLCPGLDRSFGHAQDEIGFVVAQDPAPGASLGRSSMVMLFVGAPASELVDGDADDGGELEMEVERPDVARAPERGRRRKPGLARRPKRVFDDAPAPARLDRASVSPRPTGPEEQPPTERPAATYGSDAEPGDEGQADEAQADRHEVAEHDDRVSCAQDVFAGAKGLASWDRAYPRWRMPRGLGAGGGVRAWLGRHRLAGGAAGALGMWAIVAVASGQGGGHPHAAVGLSQRPARGHQAQISEPTAKHDPKTPRATSPSVAAVPRRPSRRRAHRHRDVAASFARETAARVATPATETSAPVPVPRRAAPAPAQGGFFSP
jgi:hypothetical protein